MNAIQYVRNAGRSLGYATIDVLKSYNPVFTESASQAKSLTEEVYQSIKDFKSNLTPSGDEDSFVGQAKDAIKDIWKSTKEDITSGNWYNKQRINANQEAAFNELMGGEDFNFDFDDDFGDLEFEDDDVESAAKADIAEEKQTAREIVGSVDAIAAKSTSAIASATVHSAEHIANVQERSAKALYGLNERGFATLSKGIGAISASMNVMQSLAEPLTTHMQNSAAFYTKSTEFQNKTLELLTRIEQAVNPKEERRSSSRKLTPDDLVTNGTLDIKNYFDFVKGNIKEYTDMVTSLLDMVGGVKGAGKMAAGSPLSGLLTMAVEKMMPKVLKDNMKEFNEMFEGAVYTFLGGMKGKLPGFLSLFEDILVPNFNFKGIDQFNVNKFQKGPMKWDGIARHALTQVIPLQLSKLIALVGNQDRTMFDYRTGRWRKIKEARGEVRQKVKYNATSNDLNWEAKRVIDKQRSKKKISDERAVELNNSVDEFMLQALLSNNNDYAKIFNPNTSVKDLKNMATKYNVDLDTIELLRQIILKADAAGRRSLKTNFTGSIVKGRVNSNRILDDGDAGWIAAAYNGGYEEGEEDKANDLGTKGFLGKSVDKYGNDIFYYLQGIYSFTRHVSENLQYISSGTRYKRSSKIGKNGQFVPIREVENNNVNNTVGANRANAGKSSPGGVLSNIGAAIDEVNGQLTNIRFSSKEVENYYNTKEAYKTKHGSYAGWQNESNYNETLEEKLEKDLKSDKFFSGLESKLADSKLNPIIKSISKMFDRVGNILALPANTMAGFYSSMSTSINNALYGEGQKGGIMDWIKSAIQDFRGTMQSIGKMLAEKLGVKLFGQKDENGRYDSGKFFGRMLNQTKDTLRDAANKVKSHFGFAGGGVVTRTGIATVSKGEVIIPAGRGTKWSDLTDEQRAFIDGQLAEGVDFDTLSERKQQMYIDLANRYLNGKVSDKTKAKVFKRKQKVQNAADFLYQGGKQLFSGVQIAITKLFGKDPEKDMSDIQKKVNEKSKKLMGALEEGGGGGLAAGAILGAGTSILTGGLINPLLGAGLGAVVGFVKKSKTAQTLLFGEEGSQTKFQEAMQDFFVNNLPGVAEGAGIGGTAGIFLGSPVLGAILGGTVGFVASSDKAKDYLFGKVGEDGKRKNGLISKELQDKIKTSLPNIGAGAIAGLVAGPFGLAGNLILGSALGFASSTDGFKDWLFGKKDEQGNRQGGLLGKLREDIADPIVGIFQKLGEEMKHGFRNLAKGIKSSISKIFEKTVGKIKETTIGKKVLGFGNKVFNGALGLISTPLKGFNNLLESRHLRKGYGIRGKNGEYLDAFARQELGKNYSRYAGSIGAKYDEFLAGASADQIDLLLNNINGIKENGDFADLRNDRTRVLKRLKRSLMSASSLTAEQQDEVLQAAKSGGVDAAKAVLRKYGIDENRFSDDFDSLGKANKNLTNAKSGYDALKQLTGGNINIDDFKDLLTQEKEARTKLNEDQVKEREERKNHIITDVIPNRIDTMIKVLASIANNEPIDANSELGQDIRKYGSDVNSIFKDAKQREYDASNERAEDALNEFFDGDERAVDGAMNLRRGRQGISLKIQMAFRSLSNKLKEGIGGMFSTLFGTAKAGLKAVGAIGRLAGTLFNSGKRVVKGFFEKGKYTDRGPKSFAKNFFNLFAGPDATNIHINETAGEGSGLWDIGFADGGIVAEDGVFPLSEGEVVLPTTRNKKKEKLTELGSILTGRLGKMFKGIPIVGAINLDGVFAKRVPSLKNTLKANFGNAAGEDDTDPSAVNVAEEGDKREEGGIQQIFHNGGWIAKSDYDMDMKYKESMSKLPGNIEEVSKLGELMKPNEEAEEKKESFFDKLLGGLFGKNGEPGFLNGLFSFFTGKNLLKAGGIAGILNGISGGRGFLGIILDMLPAALGIGALTGSLDKLGSALGKTKLLNGDNNPEGSAGVLDASTVTVDGEQIQTDEHGNPLTDEDGNYIGIDGGVVKKGGEVRYYGENNTVQSRVFRNIAQGALNGLAKGSIKFMGNNVVAQGLKATVNSKSVRGAAQLIDKIGAKFASTKVGGAIGKATKTVTGWLGKAINAVINFFKKLAKVIIEKFKGLLGKNTKAAGELAEETGEQLGKAIAEEGSEQTAKTLASEIKQAAKILVVVEAVGAFTNGWGNASSYLQVVTPYQELPIVAKIVAALINTVNQLIPFVGGLIPTRIFYNAFNAAVKATGLFADSDWFKDWEEKRAEATGIVEKFNQENGYNFNIEQYNDYMHNNGVVTDISNEYKSQLATIKENYESADQFNSMIAEGVGYDIRQYAKEKGFDADKVDSGNLGVGDALKVMAGYAGHEAFDAWTNNIISKTIADRIIANEDRKYKEKYGIGSDGYSKRGSYKDSEKYKESEGKGSGLVGKGFKSSLSNSLKYIKKATDNLFGKTSSTPYIARDDEISDYDNSIVETNAMFSSVMDSFNYAGSLVKEQMAGYVKEINEDRTKFDSEITKQKTYAKNGKVKELWSKGASKASDSPLGWIFDTGSFISRMFNSTIGLFTSMGKSISSNSSDVATKSDKLFSGLGDLVDDIFGTVGRKSKSKFSKVTNKYYSGDGSGLAGRGNFVSQFNYGDMRMGTGESVADAGCGPAVAAMAARDAGVPLSMGAAVRASDNYQTSGGTDISYFGNTMGKMGIPTRTMTNKNQIYSALGGRGAILLGRDSSNTNKKNSPFGPGAHYVYSPGTDRNGNIIVNDPEGRGPRTYSPKILNKTLAAVGVGRGSKIPKFFSNIKSRFSGKSTNGGELTKEQLFAYLIKSYNVNEMQAAAIMGCWQAESGCKFKRIERDYDFHPDFNTLLTFEDVENYTRAHNVDKGRSGYRIVKDDPNSPVCCGVGLAQWTGPRGKRLIDFAVSQNRRWFDTDTQVDFMCTELEGGYKGVLDKLRGTTTIEDAVIAFAAYENSGIFPGGRLESQYWPRLEAAKILYQQLSGKPLADVSGIGSGGYGVDPRESIIKLAESQIGYFGRTKEEYEANPEDSTGYNYIGRDAPLSSKYQKYSNSGINWCGSFVSWLFDNITDHDREKYKTLLGVDYGTNTNFQIGSHPASMRKYYSNGDVPEPGDIIAYNYTGSGDKVDHVSISAGLSPDDPTKFISIDGNYPNIVARYAKKFDGSEVGKGHSGQKVTWWVRPNWEAAFPDGYFGSSYGDYLSSSAYSSSADYGSGEEGSGNTLSDYLSGINTVVSEVFARIFGKQKEEHEGEEGSNGYSSLGSYSSFGDYSSSYGSSSSGKVNLNSKVPGGDQADNWTWNRNTAVLRPKNAADTEAWNKAKTAYEKAKLIAEWNGRYLPAKLKMNWRDEEAAMKSKGGINNIIDWYMERSVPIRRDTGVYVIPNDYKKFSWKKGDASKYFRPGAVGISENSAEALKDWELVKDDPVRFFKLLAQKNNRDFSSIRFPNGPALDEMRKRGSKAICDWVDNAMPKTLPKKDNFDEWINLDYSSPWDISEFTNAFPNYAIFKGLSNIDSAISKYTVDDTYDTENDNGDGSSFENYDPNKNYLNNKGTVNSNTAGKGSGGRNFYDKKHLELQKEYNIKHLSGWGTTQGHSGTNRPSKSVYVGKGTADTQRIVTVSSPSAQRVAPETAVLLKAIVTLIESLVKNTSQVDGIFELVKTIAEQNGVSDAAMLSALNNLKSNGSDIEPGLAELKKTVDSMLLA